VRKSKNSSEKGQNQSMPLVGNVDIQRRNKWTGIVSEVGLQAF
jgi:hypothetical protein